MLAISHIILPYCAAPVRSRPSRTKPFSEEERVPLLQLWKAIALATNRVSSLLYSTLSLIGVSIHDKPNLNIQILFHLVEFDLLTYSASEQ